MMVPLTQLEVVAMRSSVDQALAALQELHLAEVVTTVEGPSPPPDLVNLIARVETLCELVARPTIGTALDDDALQTFLDDLEPRVAELQAEAEELRGEAETLPRSIGALDAVQPLVPELGRLNDNQLANLGLVSMALVLNDPDLRIVPELARQLDTLLGRGHRLATATATPGSPTGCLLVLRRNRLAEVQALLGSERILQSGVPTAYAGRSLRSTVEAMRERLSALPAERARVKRLLGELLAPAAGILWGTAATLRARAERSVAAGQAQVSPRTFTLRIWVPRERTDLVEQALSARLGAAVAIARVPTDGPDDRPVLLRNRPGWQPFQRLVGFLSWPSRDGPDPTGLMALGLPIFFGIMVGDVVYGALLLAASLVLRSRRPQGGGVIGDVGRVLGLGGCWAILFGLLYGEALGSLGHRMGMPALWFYRGGPAALEPLLLFSVAVGLGHVVLGLLLGVWTAAHGHHRRRLAAKLGTMLVLVGVCGLATVTTELLPRSLMLPVVALLTVGVITTCASEGALGLLLGPLELLGTLGNVLSYLRLAAVGLASTYLAEVANELGARGPLLLGILVAAFFHALNLALAAFSPMIQALRLHYVEFFGQFHEGGGRLFAPLGGPTDRGEETFRAERLPAPTRKAPEPVPAGSHV